MRVLVTGGAGYIGSHTCVVLQDNGHEVTVLDNFSTSNKCSLNRVQQISGTSPALLNGDIRDIAFLEALFSNSKYDAVVHFAGLKSPIESYEKPLDYFDNNVNGTLMLIRAMQKANVKKLVFSSSATVYDVSDKSPLNESEPANNPLNPYGVSKLAVERLLKSLSSSDAGWGIVCLRYFNPVGAHPSGLLGEDVRGKPTNLLPYVAKVASGELPEVTVFGDDYPTKDGTGVRDYIHVMDLARGHESALSYLKEKSGYLIANLGTGKPTSVLELIEAFKQASGIKIPIKVSPRRPGDTAECWADVSLARDVLGWEAHLDIGDMCRDAWRWEQTRSKLQES